ncbi:unnamed protein product [Blepharisma stoltei]|uniref:Mitochondrial carrier protein n=1 Tax=Blepharisma stoltei TaxID=1481888 RepID=A0AAU9INV4_9CILI|nr:unnamed protein product [Blepharisma stoltei]
MSDSRQSPGAALGAIASTLPLLISQPFDFMKVQQQVLAINQKVEIIRGSPLAHTAISQKGWSALYTGFGPALLRTFTFGIGRTYIYYHFVSKAESQDRYHSVSTMRRTACSMTAAFVLTYLLNPLDVILTRMQASPVLKPELAYHYQGLASVPTLLGKDMLKGAFANSLQKSMIAFGMLGTYDQAKSFWANNWGDVTGVKPLAAIFASITGGIFALPFDNIKTKLQVQKEGKEIYRNFLDCFFKTLHRESVWGFYVGYWSFVGRLFVNSLLPIYLLEFLRSRTSS